MAEPASSAHRPDRNPDETTVYVVDDNPELCGVLVRHFARNDLRCEAFHDAEAFLHGVQPGRAGCVVLDVRMPGMDGLELLQELRRIGDSMPVIILTGHADVNTVLKAWKHEAFQFLQKPVSPHTLLQHVRRAVEQDRRARSERSEREEYGNRIATLTRRETEVLELVVGGLSNKAVGSKLGLAQKTVEVHRSNVMRKMKTRSLAELVRMVMVARGHGGAAGS